MPQNVMPQNKILFMKALLLVLCILGFQSPALAIETTAEHAYMIDATTGTVLLDKAGDTRMAPSSMTKLMTSYIIFDKLKEGRLHLDDSFPVSEKAWRMQGSKTFVKLGSDATVENLIHGIITQSGNDACIVMAEGISGSEEAFAELMNQKAKKLGLTESHFVNATGWPDENHYSSAHDLALLSERINRRFPGIL